MKKQVAILATGGTIANTEAGRTSVDQVLGAIRERFPEQDPARLAHLRTVDVMRVAGESIGPNEWLAIGRAVQGVLDDEAVDAAIVTHGTFTVEETAYFAHLTVATPKPIVFACSQRKHGTIGNDGDRNLRDAVRVAIADEAPGKGVLVVLNEEIHSARDVTKTNQRPSGFRSGTMGPLGTIESDRVTFYRAPMRRHTAHTEFAPVGADPLPRVDVVATYAGADATAVHAFLAAGAEGLVVNGFAYNGRPTDLQIEALEEAVSKGVPVVLANRGGDGRIPTDSAHGFIRADNLTAQKARVLLSLGLRLETHQDGLQRMFDEY